MKYKLNAKDRLVIPRLLPEKGTMLEQATVKEILDMIALKSKDFAKFGIVENEMGMISPECLDPEKNPKIQDEEEFDLTKVHTQLMKDSVDKKDNAKEITQFVLNTCQKIKEMRG